MRHSLFWPVALLGAVVLAAPACSGGAEEEAASGALAATAAAGSGGSVSSPVPVATPPAWDCVGTPPPGWMTPSSYTGSGCVLLPTPGCPVIAVQGRDVCLPAGASYGGLGPPLCTEQAPCEAVSVYTVTYGASQVRWQAGPGKGGAETIELIEWRVVPEDEAALAGLRAAFEAAGVDVPPAR